MAANGISSLNTKEDKQQAKLTLAASKRLADGRPATLDINKLPTKYVGNNIVDNPGELQPGRPWSL